MLTWTYQHSTSIQCRRHYRDTVTISEFAIASSKVDPTMIFVLILTNNYYIEIYSGTSLNKEPIFTVDLRSAAKIHATQDGTFLLVTNKGVLQCIAQQTQHSDQVEFHQTVTTQLKIATSSMFSTLVTLNDLEHLVVLADNGQSMALWNGEQMIYVDMPVSSLSIKSIDGYSTNDHIFLHLTDQTLLSCRIDLNPPMIQMDSCGRIDKFACRNDCVAMVNDEKKQLDLRKIPSHSSCQQIQLDHQCEHLCLNESATHVFTIIKPRMLWMYRVSDGRPLAKLFLFDFVLSMTADKYFLVLAMNDRRLLTLMIADPNDLSISKQIRALPSR